MRDPKWHHLLAPPRLRRWRTQVANLIQVQAAQAIGIDLPKYNAFECARSRPGLDIAWQIERVTSGYVKATDWAQEMALDARRARAA